MGLRWRAGDILSLNFTKAAGLHRGLGLLVTDCESVIYVCEVLCCLLFRL